jgi:hypothetical protein
MKFKNKKEWNTIRNKIWKPLFSFLIIWVFWNVIKILYLELWRLVHRMQADKE